MTTTEREERESTCPLPLTHPTAKHAQAATRPPRTCGIALTTVTPNPKADDVTKKKKRPGPPPPPPLIHSTAGAPLLARPV